MGIQFSSSLLKQAYTLLFFLRKLSMKTAICLVVYCFLLNSRFESGSAAKTQLAKLKSASFLEEANEHVHVGATSDAPNGGEVALMTRIAAHTLRASPIPVNGMELDNVCTNTNVCFIAMSHLERTI